jgi:formyltetrahydrofolate synthetase
MKISYDREQDIMLLELSAKPIKYAEKMGPVIVHFTKDEKPVLLEILDASEFIAAALKTSLRAKQEELQPV